MQLRFLVCFFGSILLLTHAVDATPLVKGHHRLGVSAAADAVNRTIAPLHFDWIPHQSRPAFAPPVLSAGQSAFACALPSAEVFLADFSDGFNGGQHLAVLFYSRPPPLR